MGLQPRRWGANEANGCLEPLHSFSLIGLGNLDQRRSTQGDVVVLSNREIGYRTGICTCRHLASVGRKHENGLKPYSSALMDAAGEIAVVKIVTEKKQVLGFADVDGSEQARAADLQKS